MKEVFDILKKIPHQNFDVVEKYGSDIFSGVVVAKNNKLAGRLESIKYLDSFEPNQKEQFIKEAKVLSSINHNNIPKVYDLIVQDNVILFRTQHIKGHSLKEVLDYMKKKRMIFPKSIASSIILKLMRSLDYTHNSVEYEGKKVSIIHCDIKPSNIILSSKENSSISDLVKLVLKGKTEPYLIDFGIANFKGQSTSDGTLSYLSPAQVNGDDLDWKVDIYQLMLVYYEMLVGKKPFSGMKRIDILETKKTKDFKAKFLSGKDKEIIEGCTCKKIKFKSEHEIIKKLSSITSTRRKVEFVKRNKVPIISVFSLIILVLLSIMSYNLWDYHVNSTDAILKTFNQDMSVEEFNYQLDRLQRRAFEKKYYEPLLAGDFRDPVNGTPLYPSHLDVDGSWLLNSEDSKEAGAFVGLLFNYVDEYPELLNYAIEFAEPLVESEFDGADENRFMYGLIPAYEVTGDEIYLNKLINISNNLATAYKIRKGMNNVLDTYHVDLFLWLHDKTNDEKYLNIYENHISEFITHNIDLKYIYDATMVNATTPMGKMPDTKWTKLFMPFDDRVAGRFLTLSDENKNYFKNITSVYSRDYLQSIIMLHKLYVVTNGSTYLENRDILLNHYLSYEDDKLFLCDSCDIPDDTYATMRLIKYYKVSSTNHKSKLIELLNSNKFNLESENGVLTGSVYLPLMKYDFAASENEDQTLIFTDKLFLELK